MARNPTKTMLPGVTDVDVPMEASTSEKELIDAATGEVVRLVGVAANPVREGPKVRHWRVMNGGMVMYEGAKTPVRSGKIYAENTVDMANLKRQGIVFEEVEME
jgi:hypothetical protein